MILAHITFQIAFVALVVRSRLVTIGRDIEEAARDLFAGTPYLLRRVTLPLLLPGIVAGAMLAFVISLDDVVITEFVKSSGQETLPTYMLGQLRRIITPEINAISTVLVSLSIIVVGLFFVVDKKFGK